MEAPTLPLSELATFVRRVFALNLPAPVWVTAEVAQVNHSRGHVWLTFVEKAPEGEALVAQLDGVIWSRGLQRLRRERGSKVVNGLLRPGLSVRMRVTASFHERFGLRLVVNDLDPAFTVGQLEQRRLANLEALREGGLLDRNAAVPLPPVLRRLAVISSDTAAGLADFRRQLEQNPYGYVFTQTLYPAAMQGAETVTEITTRLRQIARRAEEYDAIVIVRGGGGKTDLAAFDDLDLSRAVAAAARPVLAGIGHEIDETLLDRVVHRSLKTPTAVAAFLVDRLAAEEGRLLQIGRRIARTVESQLRQQEARLSRLAEGIDGNTANALRTEHLRTAARAQLLEALRPETTLARGYALVSQDGHLVTDPRQLAVGPVRVQLREGEIKLNREA